MERLSVEIAEFILLQLGALDIVRSRAISRRFLNLVDASIALQYKVELHVAGLQDILYSHPSYSKASGSAYLSVRERLDLLRTEQASFKRSGPIVFERINSFQLNAHETFSLGHSEHYVLRACTLAGTHAVNPSHCALLDLNLEKPIESEIQWKCPDLATALETECFDVDVPLRLLAVRRPPQSGLTEITFFDLFTGEPHPRASQNPLVLDVGTADIPSGNLDIVGEIIILTMSKDEQTEELFSQENYLLGFITMFIIIDWTTGETLRTFSFADVDYIVAAAPIAPYHFIILSKTGEIGSIDLYSISSRNPSSTPSRTVDHRARFILPPFFPFTDVIKQGFSVDVQVSQTPRLPSKTSIFVPTETASIVCIFFNFWIDPPGGNLPNDFGELQFRTINFISPVSTFLRRQSASRKDSFETYNWEEWGPPNTRWFYGDSPDNRNEACGYRLLDKSCNWILDFNPLDIARDLVMANINPPESLTSGGQQIIQPAIVINASEIPQVGVFAHPLAGYLPYREIRAEGLEDDSVLWASTKVITVKQDDLGDPNITISLYAPKP